MMPQGYEMGSFQKYTPQQMKLFQSLFSQVDPNSQTAQMARGDQSAFGQIEAPAMRQFGQLQGDIASRFSGMGLGGRRGSGFQNTMNTAASNFAMDLKSQRQQLQRQAMMDLMGMSNTLLGQNPFEQFMVKKQYQPNFFQTAIGSAAPIVGGALGSYGGPMGSAIGAQMGSAFGNAIMGGGQQQMDFSGIGNLPTKWSP